VSGTATTDAPARVRAPSCRAATRVATSLFWGALVLVAGCATGGGTGGGAPALDKAQIATLVASPDRSAADRRNDERRKPEQMLAFIGVRPGMVALDVSAAGGYTSELLARAVGPTGRVFAQTARPTSPTLAERTRTPSGANIVPVVLPFDNPVPVPVDAGGLDLVTLMFNYHDFGHLGVDRSRVNAAVFRALKPGGLYVIADHSGRPGTGITESGTLHRVEEALVRSEVEAAGFRLAATGDFLRNPNDPRDRNEPEPPQPKDEFVLKFVKP
jgi:predicted methyltransferase